MYLVSLCVAQIRRQGARTFVIKSRGFAMFQRKKALITLDMKMMRVGSSTSSDSVAMDAFSHRRLNAHESNAITTLRHQHTRNRRSKSNSDTLCPCYESTEQPPSAEPVLQVLNVPIRLSSDIASGKGKEHHQLRSVLKYISRQAGWRSPAGAATSRSHLQTVWPRYRSASVAAS